GATKIVSQREQTSKRSSSRSDTETADVPSDSAIKQKLLGYWSSPRHGYHIASDGTIYMCPRKYATTTSHWTVKNGKFYWGSSPHTIVNLTDSKFVYREVGGYGTTFT